MSANSEPPGIRLIVGLGNPGREYADTRHNVGFMILDLLAARAGAKFRAEKAWQAEIARVDDVWLCKPQTYMNLSGQSVRPLSQFYKLDPAQVLVVLDDVALPLGRLRLRPEGSAGGHNGLKSIIEHFGTPAVPRLRVGIGAADHAMTDHVLGRFTLEEKPALDQSLDRALEAIACLRDRGLAATMNAYN
jgi:PTH1 family peptidyl-tRNA hydrolase